MKAVYGCEHTALSVSSRLMISVFYFAFRLLPPPDRPSQIIRARAGGSCLRLAAHQCQLFVQRGTAGLYGERGVNPLSSTHPDVSISVSTLTPVPSLRYNQSMPYRCRHFLQFSASPTGPQSFAFHWRVMARDDFCARIVRKKPMETSAPQTVVAVSRRSVPGPAV